MGRITVLFSAACLLAGLSPVSLFAQTPSDNPAGNAAIQLGALAVQPTFGLTNVGLDTNVYNDASNQRDFTATVGPGAKTWLRAGAFRFSGVTRADWVYFERNTKQRSVDFNQQGRAELQLASLTPYFEADYLTTRQRPNPEIDVRARRRTKGFTGGTAIRLGPLVALDLAAGHNQITYATGIVFDGVDLGQALDQGTDHASLALRWGLTPLTTFVVKGEAERDRFQFSPVRNADTFAVEPGFEFKPLALLSGTAFAGYRKFTPKSSSLPAFSGPVASVNVIYAAATFTRVTATFDRDVVFSFEPTQPYFVLTGGGFAITQLLAGNWDAVLRATRQRLDYRSLLTTEGGALPDRLDHAALYGVGIGYRLRIDVRIGVDVNHSQRRSPQPGRSYNGYTVGASFTYGS